MLKIANNLSLPVDAATQTFAILAKRGAGKTYTALVMIEEMLKANLQVAVIDPIGVTWGLRAAANGKDPGLPIIVMGGDHGDVPLEVGAGKVVADFIVQERQSVVLDLSLFRKGEQVRFMVDFAETLYHKNRAPLHLMLDEADSFAPQRPMHDQARMLGAVEDLVRRGRARGIGVTLVTQRAAVLNKDVLTQVEVLVALRTIAPQDRDAIDAWIKVHGTPKQREKLMESLPSLPIGEAWFWSPGWLDIFQRVSVRKRTTFDSSATPEIGAKAATPKNLAQVDLDKLKEKIAATIERAKAEDPKELKRQVAELKKQIGKTDHSECKALLDQHKRRIGVLENIIASANYDVKTAEMALDKLKGQLLRMDQEHPGVVMVHKMPDSQAVRRSPVKRDIAGSIPALAANSNGNRFRAPDKIGEPITLGKCEQAILGVLTQHGACDINRLAVLSGYRKSGGFKNSISRLRQLGLLEGANTGLMIITRAGTIETDLPQLPMGRDLFLYWLNSPRMGTCEREIMQALQYAESGLTMEEIANRADYSISGGFKNSLSKLRTAGVIVGKNTERMKLNDDLL